MVEKVFWAILVTGAIVLVSLQTPPSRPDPCKGLVMADCGRPR